MDGRWTALTLALGLSIASSARAEEIEISFDLEQYTHEGHLSFSRGCTANPATGRNNYVHLTVVWLEDDAGNYVTTLRRWGRTYVYNLKTWAVASDMAIDGLTSATPTSNGNRPGQVFRNFNTGQHDISWLPDGTYTVRIESTQCELADEYRSGTTPRFGPQASFTFTKGRTSQSNLSLGSAAPFNNVTVQYTVPAANNAPGAWAGLDQRLRPSVNPSEATTMLSGTVDDDSGTPTVSWQLVSSEPTGLSAQIVDAASAQTEVRFNTAGIYTFRLTATDAQGASSSDEVEVWVNAYTIDVSHDAEVARGRRNDAMGIIENAGPWLFSWGQCNAGDNYSRGYLRFDLSSVSGPITSARLRLPKGEGRPDPSVYHDFYLLTDAQDDWNGSNPSTDWEATMTFNNQPVIEGLASNLDPLQLIGSYQHDTCAWRHGFDDPTPPIGPASDCPGWVELPLDVAVAATYDNNDEWSLFMTPRTGCNSGMGIGSKENLINPQMVVVEFWQSAANQPPVADAGPDRVVVDQLPSGEELVTLDASGSTDDGNIVSYAWSRMGQSLGQSPQPDGVQALLPLGAHDLTLLVTDGGGLTGMDTVQMTVEDRFYPNQDESSAALIDGTPSGKRYADLYASAAGGDWYALDLVDGTDLTVSLAQGNDLSVTILDAGQNPVQTCDSPCTSPVSAPALSAGRYFVQVEAAASGEVYALDVQVAGATLVVELDPSSGLESAGTLSGAGTVSVSEAPMAPVSITLSADLPEHLSFGANPVVLEAGQTEVSFDLVLMDDPAGAPDADRFVTINASAAGYNPGSAIFEVLDDEASLVVSWDKVEETVSESGSPLVVLTAVLSGMPRTPITVPFSLGGTAQAGADYELMNASMTLTFTDSIRETVLISIKDDELDEMEETLIVTMGSPQGANPGQNTEYTLTLQDNDEPMTPMMPMMPTPPEEGGGCSAVHGPVRGFGGANFAQLFGLWFGLCSATMLWRRKFGPAAAPSDDRRNEARSLR